MDKMLLLFFFIPFLITGCVEKSATLQDQFQPDDAKIFRDSFSIRDKTVPLPPGDWKIQASGFDTEKFFRVFLIQEHENKSFSYITIQVDSIELDREYGYWKSKELKRTDMHHVVEVRNGDGEEQEGWWVNNFIITITPKEDLIKIYNDAITYLKSHNFVIPNDIIEVGHVLTGKHPYKKRLLIVKYKYNPEAAGFSPTPKAEWATSDWNAMRVTVDPKKVEYINDLINQHALMHEKIKAGFHPKESLAVKKDHPIASSTKPIERIKTAADSAILPPDNIKKEINQKCMSDFPSDFVQQAECVKRQEASWIELNG